MKISIGPYTDGPTEREVSIQIDSYDTWSMNHTLALIIVPMLKQLKETTHGAAMVCASDVPEHLRVGDSHELIFKRWDWVLDEMIESFQMLVDGDDIHPSQDQFVKMQNGVRLFTKYFFDLWD